MSEQPQENQSQSKPARKPRAKAAPKGPRTLLVFGRKTFKITIPPDAKVTFGPFSPPNTNGRENWVSSGRAEGTLRVYQGTKENIIACFVGVNGFRDLSLEYAEEIAKEEGATIWKSDQHGYEREEKVSRRREWANDTLLLEAPNEE